PLMFTVSGVLLINKIDVAEIFDFDYAACESRAKALNPGIEVIRLSSLTGEGFESWISCLTGRVEKRRNGHESD
ncbi:MAG: hydrogenase accessory protein HypB, partial [Oscillospiraceae bacterium]|nr:hydrogenase accessory protein HypB [Oscillospiraceae bacterium]